MPKNHNANTTTDKVTPKSLEETLIHLLRDTSEYPSGMEIRAVESFEEAGLLTSDRGIIILTEDGSEFQLTIVQRR
jgi:hypothetical protein